MSVSIACSACSASIRLTDTVCRSCGRALSQDEQNALELRFESTNTDYREAKLTVSRALTVSLVVGLLTTFVGGVRFVLALTSDADGDITSSTAAAVVELVIGLTLAACFLGAKRSVTVSLCIATTIWVLAIVLPIVAAPAQAILGLASAGGVALNLGRLGALLLLIQGISASRRMKHLLAATAHPPGSAVIEEQKEMDALEEHDVPYGNNWDSPAEAAAYGDAADQERPWRAQIRDHIASRVATLAPRARVLELGSGPGLLAQRVLQRNPDLETYTLLDFSEPMLALSRERLSSFPAASFVRASFKSEDWPQHVDGRFDCVLSMQAIHELRHKRHAQRVYRHAHDVLTARGVIMVCDHTPFDDSERSTALYMSQDEQQTALLAAGFANVRVELCIDSLVVYAGDRAA